MEDLFQFALREGNSKKPVYEIHKWWARRLGHVFKFLLLAATTPAPRKDERLRRAAHRLVKRFYRNNDLKGIVILDPFMGGGTSVVESLKCGAHVVGVDIDPVAWFITKKSVEPFDEERVNRAYNQLAQAVETDLRALYKTRGVTRNDDAEIVNAFWVHRIQCPRCRHAFDGHPHYRLSLEIRNDAQVVFCRHCGEVERVPLGREKAKCKKCRKLTTIEAGTVSNGIYTCPYCDHRGSIQNSQVRDGRSRNASSR